MRSKGNAKVVNAAAAYRYRGTIPRPLVAGNAFAILFRFRKKPGWRSLSAPVSCTITIYGLHRTLPQLVLFAPPSARTKVGITKVLRKRTAAPRTSRVRFMMVVLLCECESDGDNFTPSKVFAMSWQTFERSEFVTR